MITFLILLFLAIYLIVCLICTTLIIDADWAEFLKDDPEDDFFKMSRWQKLLLFLGSPIILF